ncbi:hypothetical protein BT96DRAFT_1021914 [Gymnopus androsaceus JB14]|uniref:Uncharacterized protein n=1 Tax=Gymnopus androsaceus JB14 TaxID=1447944 RepID=A0A6A4HB22_9AGAR|nr:hypothetical protein BT96DRAFT_1021914 [Gymnopus androsaceus JB14]
MSRAYNAYFGNSPNHVAVVNALAKEWTSTSKKAQRDRYPEVEDESRRQRTAEVSGVGGERKKVAVRVIAVEMGNRMSSKRRNWLIRASALRDKFHALIRQKSLKWKRRQAKQDYVAAEDCDQQSASTHLHSTGSLVAHTTTIASATARTFDSIVLSSSPPPRRPNRPSNAALPNGFESPPLHPHPHRRTVSQARHTNSLPPSITIPTATPPLLIFPLCTSLYCLARLRTTCFLRTSRTLAIGTFLCSHLPHLHLRLLYPLVDVVCGEFERMRCRVEFSSQPGTPTEKEKEKGLRSITPPPVHLAIAPTSAGAVR